MTTAREKMKEIGERLAARSAEASSIGGVYRFDLQGEGGGSFVVNLRDAIGVQEGDGPAACTLRLSTGDFLDLISGKVSGQELFFGQRLTVEGDMGLALKLQALTDLLR
ncbi:MAG TPA: SCP2 sterol-binding domain-containing protein [Polyangiaceae bacterium]|nr:SCP2 sterol-binding domain-containing protein [Polyangiaceae bacterium]